MRRDSTILPVILAALTLCAAQIRADSQFGARGLGISDPESHARGWAMGGISYALSDSVRATFVNPALAAGINKVSFTLLYSSDRRTVTDGDRTNDYNTRNFPYVAFLAPFGRRVSAGLGYNLVQDLSTARINSGFVEADTAEGVPEHTLFFERSGSIFRVPGNVAFLLPYEIRVGFRVDGYFGNARETFEIQFNDPEIEDTEETLDIGVSGVGWATGVAFPFTKYANFGFTYVSDATLDGTVSARARAGRFRAWTFPSACLRRSRAASS